MNAYSVEYAYFERPVDYASSPRSVETTSNELGFTNVKIFEAVGGPEGPRGRDLSRQARGDTELHLLNVGIS